MSKAPFIECLSEDPVIRALARKAVRLLNDPSLTPARRQFKLQQVQKELLAHQTVLAEIADRRTARKARQDAQAADNPTKGQGTKASAKQLAAMRRDCSRAGQAPATAEVSAPAAPVQAALKLLKTTPSANDASSRTLHLRHKPLPLAA